MPSEQLTVLVADDQPMMRETLRDDLEREGLLVVGEAVDGVDAVERAVETRPAVCLLDMNMPRASGIDAAAEISRRLGTATSVVLISAEVSADAVLDALRAGAAGFLSKGIDPHRLGAALRAVARGESAFPRRELRQALARLVPRAA